MSRSREIAGIVVFGALLSASCTDARQVLRAVAPCPDATADVVAPEDSIQDAIDDAADGAVLCLAAGVHAERLVVPDKSVTIVGLGGWQNTIIDAEGRGLVVDILAGSGTVTLRGVTIQGGFVQGQPGALVTGAGVRVVDRPLVLQDVRIHDNTVEATRFWGVGLAVFGVVSPTLERVRVDGNVARAVETMATDVPSAGIGLHFAAGLAPTLRRVVVVENRTDGSERFTRVVGGGVYGGGPVDADELVVVNNTAEAADVVVGAGFATVSGTATIRRSHIGGNTGRGDRVLGAGLSAPVSTLEDVDVVGNSAEGAVEVQGAGIYLGRGFLLTPPGNTLDATRVRIIGNQATAPTVLGAGVYTEVDNNTLDQLIIADNHIRSTTLGRGAGLYAAAPIGLRQSTVVFNDIETDADPDAASIWLGAVAGSPRSVVYNSVVALNPVGGIAAINTVPDVTFVDLYNAPAADVFAFQDPVGVAGNVSLAPEFVTAKGDNPQEWDLRLSAGSPLMDTGDAAITDSDGTRSDPGAFGGPSADSWLDLAPESIARLLE